jgi:hypothetical protein
MRKFSSRTIVLVAGSSLAAAVLGTGAAFASTQHTQAPTVSKAPVVTHASVAGVISPHTVAKVASQHPVAKAAAAAEATDPVSGAVDGDTLQQGDQTTPDPATSAAETTSTESPEAPSTEADAPGGHADGPGNVDHQFNGNE